MELKKLYTIIIIIGILVFTYGSYQFYTNQPKQFDTSQSEQTIFGRDDLGNLLGVRAENNQREKERESATTIMIISGLIVLLGGFLRVYGKQGTTLNTDSTSNTQIKNQNDDDYCTNCGARIRYGNKCSNCNSN